MAASPTPVDFETGATQAPRCTRNRLDQHQPNPPVTGWRSAIAPDLRKRGWYQAGPDRSVELRLRCAPAIKRMQHHRFCARTQSMATDSPASLIGVLNAGSSSLKFAFYEEEHLLLSGQVEGIGVPPHASAAGLDGKPLPFPKFGDIRPA